MGGRLRTHRRGGAEHNLIQAPEINRRLTSRFGLRQGHVASSLGEGIQPVVVVDDLREAKEIIPRQTFLGGFDCNPNLVIGDEAYCALENPLGSGVAVRLLQVVVNVIDVITAGGVGQVHISLDTIPGGGLLHNRVDVRARNAFADPLNGQYQSRAVMVRGTVIAGFGIANQLERYVWPWNGAAPPAVLSGTIKFQWDHGAGPYYQPGKAVEILPATFSLASVHHVGFMWQEEPLSDDLLPR